MSLGFFEAGRSIEYTFSPANKCLFIFAIRGGIDVSGHALPQRDALGIWDTDRITIACNEDAEFLVIETPINQK